MLGKIFQAALARGLCLGRAGLVAIARRQPRILRDWRCDHVPLLLSGIRQSRLERSVICQDHVGELLHGFAEAHLNSLLCEQGQARLP